MRSRRRDPRVTSVDRHPDRTIWEIRFPGTAQVIGSTYFATTYPDRDQISLQTGARRQPVAMKTAAALEPRIRSAIARKLAEGDEHGN